MLETLLPGIENVFDDDGPGSGPSVAAAEWFMGRKRSLLAEFGVGTIDQALVSVLQVKHNAVRLYGLTGKAVVIDEVHAYDTYMTTLMERLLEWLAALGSPVVLLSATLPAERRRALMVAYLRGLGFTFGAAATIVPRYPGSGRLACRRYRRGRFRPPIFREESVMRPHLAA